MKHWTTYTEAALRKLYPLLPVGAVAEQLGFSVHAVRRKAEKLGLRKDRAPRPAPGPEPEPCDELDDEPSGAGLRGGQPKIEVITEGLPDGYVRVLRHTWFRQRDRRLVGRPAR